MDKQGKVIVTPPASADSVSFYPAGYKKKGYAPEKYPSDVVEALSKTLSDMRSRKKINKVAEKIFLANALVENHPSPDIKAHGVVPSTFSEAESDAIIDRMMKMQKAKGDKNLLAAQRYGAVLDYKTGKFADAVLGKNATEEQRIESWNGKGRAFDKNTGRMADSKNHVAKVLAMEKALSSPDNAEIINLFRKSSKSVAKSK